MVLGGLGPALAGRRGNSRFCFHAGLGSKKRRGWPAFPKLRHVCQMRICFMIKTLILTTNLICHIKDKIWPRLKARGTRTAVWYQAGFGICHECKTSETRVCACRTSGRAEGWRWRASSSSGRHGAPRYPRQTPSIPKTQRRVRRTLRQGTHQPPPGHGATTPAGQIHP
jgi:hypothetical protein